jgi:DNA-binding NarL/FixJ family response regulator
LGRHADQIDQAGPRLSSLTSREREVVEQLVGGVTDREIARTLLISTRTVHKHLESIYRKLGIGNRTSLMTLIHQTNEVIQRTADHSVAA